METRMKIDIPKLFIKQAKQQRRKIAIAIMHPIPETIESLKRGSEYADLVVVGAEVPGFENIVESDQDKTSDILIDLLRKKEVDGIVRGQAKDTYTLDLFYQKFDLPPVPSNRKVVIAVMHKEPYTFFVSTCSVYQGMTPEDKIYEVESIAKHMQEDFGITPKIGIMSSLRPTSKHGKYPLLDDMYEVNAKLCEVLKGKGYDATEYFFEYETGVWQGCNLIVPSMGLVGNAWLKALLYLGDWELLSCNYLNVGGVVYEDGTRNEKDFFWHIVHAVALANNAKRNGGKH